MDSKSEIKNISYVYDANNNIQSVIIPYSTYLQIMASKRQEVLENTIPSYVVGYSIIQDAIQELRAKKWTLSKIALLLGTSQSNLSRLLKRPVQIKKETLSRYMDVLAPYLD